MPNSYETNSNKIKTTADSIIKRHNERSDLIRNRARRDDRNLAVTKFAVGIGNSVLAEQADRFVNNADNLNRRLEAHKLNSWIQTDVGLAEKYAEDPDYFYNEALDGLIKTIGSNPEVDNKIDMERAKAQLHPIAQTIAQDRIDKLNGRISLAREVQTLKGGESFDEKLRSLKPRSIAHWIVGKFTGDDKTDRHIVMKEFSKHYETYKGLLEEGLDPETSQSVAKFFDDYNLPVKEIIQTLENIKPGGINRLTGEPNPEKTAIVSRIGESIVGINDPRTGAPIQGAIPSSNASPNSSDLTVADIGEKEAMEMLQKTVTSKSKYVRADFDKILNEQLGPDLKDDNKARSMKLDIAREIVVAKDALKAEGLEESIAENLAQISVLEDWDWVFAGEYDGVPVNPSLTNQGSSVNPINLSIALNKMKKYYPGSVAELAKKNGISFNDMKGNLNLKYFLYDKDTARKVFSGIPLVNGKSNENKEAAFKRLIDSDPLFWNRKHDALIYPESPDAHYLVPPKVLLHHYLFGTTLGKSMEEQEEYDKTVAGYKAQKLTEAKEKKKDLNTRTGWLMGGTE